MYIYRILDSKKSVVAVFKHYKDALQFAFESDKDYTIQRFNKEPNRKPTQKMLRTVLFIESVLNIKCESDEYYEISNFIAEYLDSAKIIWEEAMSSYDDNFD